MTEVKYDIGGVKVIVEYDENGIAKITRECFEVLIEKKIPKKPIQLKGYKEPCFCPVCEPSDETFVKANYDHDKYNYCPICGQKLDWGNENDKKD